MQRHLLKILIIITLSIPLASSLSAQVSSFRLHQADSLYEKKRYTQSLEHYQTILNQQEYSPAMLLKMAFIEEGLNRVGQSLYYLNLYYLASNDKFVLEKMEELAAKYNLSGYENSETDQLLSFYHDYHLYLSITLMVISVFLLSLSFYTRKKGKRPVASTISLGVILILLLIHVNTTNSYSSGIIGEPNSYLMDGPSAGASVVSVIEEGHRVRISGKIDVWYEVKWNENTVYVRDNDVLVVEL
jgi:hypothetical protein